MGREDGKKRWEEKMGRGAPPLPHLCISYRRISVPLHSPVLHLPIYEHLHMGRAQKSTEKEGTPHGGALLIQTTELQAVAR